MTQEAEKKLLGRFVSAFDLQMWLQPVQYLHPDYHALAVEWSKTGQTKIGPDSLYRKWDDIVEPLAKESRLKTWPAVVVLRKTTDYEFEDAQDTGDNEDEQESEEDPDDLETDDGDDQEDKDSHTARDDPTEDDEPGQNPKPSGTKRKRQPTLEGSKSLSKTGKGTADATQPPSTKRVRANQSVLRKISNEEASTAAKNSTSKVTKPRADFAPPKVSKPKKSATEKKGKGTGKSAARSVPTSTRALRSRPVKD